jgi:hypothetical protein
MINGSDMKSNYSKTIDTKRFTFGVNRSSTSHQAGSNVVTISTRTEQDGYYSTPTTQLSMTVKEARALQGFLNNSLTDSSEA